MGPESAAITPSAADPSSVGGADALAPEAIEPDDRKRELVRNRSEPALDV